MVMSTLGSGGEVATDPEVIAGVAVLGAAFAVASFILFRIVISAGQELESPPPIQALRRAFFPSEGGR